VQHEWEFQNWKASEAAAEKERKERGTDEFVPNLFKLMLHRNKDQVNDRVFAKWSKKAPLFCKGNWTAVRRPGPTELCPPQCWRRLGLHG
jgi:hypothetical protein